MRLNFKLRSRPHALLTARSLAGIAIAIAISSRADDASAYRTAADLQDFVDGVPVAWNDAPTLAMIGSPPGDVAQHPVDQAVRAAVGLWNESSCMLAPIAYIGFSETLPSSGTIAVEWVDAWRERGLPAGTPGTTDVRYVEVDGRWTIGGAHIFLNAEEFDWGTETASSLNTTWVVAHELGHAIGLLHNCEERGSEGAPVCGTSTAFLQSVMYPDYQVGRAFALSPDDEAGLCFLFGEPVCDGGTKDNCAPGCDCQRPEATPGDLGDPCGASAECAEGYCTVDGYCGRLCLTNTDCAAGFACTSDSEPFALECAPLARVFGEVCESASECSSAMCLVRGGETSGVCTRECGESSSTCPSEYACVTFGEKRVCAHRAHANGCSIGIVRQSGGQVPLLVLALGAVMSARSRRRKGPVK